MGEDERKREHTTFRTREREFASTLCDEMLFLTCDGLQPEVTDDDLLELSPTELANITYASLRELAWTEDDTLHILLDPSLLDNLTENAFRRKLRYVFERADPDESFPYDYLDCTGERAAWLTNCLESGEIRSPKQTRADGVEGIRDDQRDLNSF